MKARWIAMWPLLAASCGVAPENGRYAGALSDDSDARMAAIVEDGSILLFLCGGPSSLARTRWFSGSLHDDHFALTKKGVTIEGRFEDGLLMGDFDDGHTVALERAEDVGLFHTREGACRTGVIVADHWMQGVSCDPAGRLQQVSPDGPMSASGFMVASGSRRLFVSPVHPR